MPVYGFADQAEFDRAKAAIRAMEEFLRRGQDQEYRYESPAATVVVKANGDIDDGGSAPSETGVYACRVVFRDFTVTDPDAAGAWVEVPGARWCEAYAPNKEALVVGKRYRGRFVGYSTVSPFRPRVEVTSVAGTTGQLVVKPLAAGAGDGTWTDALVMVQSGTGWIDGTEHVRFQPRSLGMKEKANLLWWSCWDTGQVDTGFTPNRRKIIGVDPPMVKRRMLVLCDGSTPKYADVWQPDVD